MYEQQLTQYSYQSQENAEIKQVPYIGFKGRMFPLLGALIATISILWSYYIAVTSNPRHVKPFPWTDITHCAIKFPEYVIFRVGMMVAPVIFGMSFQILKNYLEVKCLEILGRTDDRLKIYGKLSIIAPLALCISTSTISDGGDMNWTLHTVGATSFFLIGIWMILRASKIYRQLWPHQHFCPEWSYQIKKYSNFILAFILVLEILSGLQIIDIGSFLEWFAAFYLIAFFFTLYWDFKDFDMLLIRK